MSNEAPQQTLKQPVQPPMQIELQNVKKVYPVTGGEVVALDNISLTNRKSDISSAASTASTRPRRAKSSLTGKTCRT